MLARIRKLLVPPVFKDDAEKTRSAAVLNAIVISVMLSLLVTQGFAVPFFFVQKLYSSIVLLTLMGILMLVYGLMHRGHVRFASALLVSAFWLVFTVFLSFSGGMTSVVVSFYVTTTVTTGLLLGKRAALIQTAACIVAGLAMIVLDSSLYALPRLFPIPPVTGWIIMVLSLSLTLIIVSLVMRSLNEALTSVRESEERYRQLFEAESDAIFLIDNTTGQILEANGAASLLYGYPHAVLLTMKNTDLSAEPAETHHLTQTTPVNVDRVINIPLRYHRKQDGTVFPVEITGRFFARQGHSLHIAAIRDITQRSRIEEALRQSEALYRQAIEVIGAVPYYQEYGTGTYTFIGEGILDLSGYEPEEMTPDLWHSLVEYSVMLGEAAGLDREEAVHRAQLDQIHTWKSDDRIRTRDGQIRWVMDASVKILNDQGVSYAALGILQDVTERKIAEEALRESNRRLEATLAELRETQERMVHQERLAAVGQLAAGIAHDFNNILASIVLYTHMTLRSEELPIQVRSRLEIIAQQTNHAAELVQQILDFGRRSVLERQSLALDSFLKEVVKLLRRTLPENISIDLDFTPDDYHIHADITRIQQVVVNLALNARDAMPNGGRLHISLSKVSNEPIYCVNCGPIVGGPWVQITVSDTGTGIPSDVLPHIFEPFFTTRAPLGHGLGLAQVHGIVKQHDGHIDVQTQVGEGTTFRLYWPAMSVAEPQPIDDVSSDVEQGHGETILVVEDDAVIRTAVVDVLDMLGYRVIEASNGQEALDVCARCASDSSGTAQNIHLVLSDWVMPVLGGLELVRELEKRCPTVRVVLMTGYPLTEEAKDVVPQNVVGWLLKPLRIEQLTDVVYQALSKKGVMDE